MKKCQIYIFLLLLNLLIGCNKQQKYKKSKGWASSNESFSEFYEKFHKDSLFQISRIVFPLPGINSDEMTVEDSTYFWKKEDWLLQHIIDTTIFYKATSMTDTIVEEVITSKDPGVMVSRKFQNIKGKWYLVSYEDVNL